MMRRTRYILPPELPEGDNARMFRRDLPLLVMLLLPPVAGYFRSGWVAGTWGWGVAGLLISGGFAFMVWHGVSARITSGNTEIYRRCARPVRYWLAMSLWGAAYLGTTAVFFIHPQ